MAEWVSVVVATVAGLVAGFGSHGRLRTRFYRYAAEPRPERSLTWVIPATALASGLIAWALRDWPPVVVVTSVIATWAMIVMAAVDVDVHRLPRQLTWPSYPALALLLTGCSAAVDDWAASGRAGLAGLATWTLYYLLHRLARRRGLGRGDVTLAGLIGMLLGWFSWTAIGMATYAAFLLGGGVALVLVLARRVTRKANIAFGPAMLAGAYLVLLLQ